MAIEIAIPKLGMTMTKAKVAKWAAQEGELIKKDQVVLVIETEKVTYEVEAQGEGYLHIIIPEGEDAEVAQSVGQLAETEDELAALQAETPSAAPSAAPASEEAAPAPAEASSPEASAPRGKVRITPRAKRKAKALNIDYSNIAGSGPGGRIVERDIDKAASAPQPAQAASAPTGPVVDGKQVKEIIPLAGMRKSISEHMVYSLTVSAQLTAGMEVDMTQMINFRTNLKNSARFKEAGISFNEIFIYILAKVLKEQPIMNSSIIDDKIHLWEDVNVGLAVALQGSGNTGGLAVPVIRNADRLSLLELGQSIRDIVVKARSGRLELNDMEGGTFTLTNTGSFTKRWTWATPVLNQPQVGILQTGATVDRCVPVDGEITIKPLMPLILTFDHRVLDGADAAQFIVRVSELMEDPYQLID